MGGGGSTEQQSSTQSVNQVQLPPWVNQAAQKNYALAENVSQQPYQAYQGQQVANIGPQMQQAWDLAASAGNAGADQYNAAQAGYLSAMNTPYLSISAGTVTPGTVTPQTLAAANLNPYMNPYTQDVINKTLPIMQQNLALQQNQAQNAANSANAYGGSRQAIQQGVTQAQGALGMGQMAAQLNAQNFAQAQAGAQYDIGNNLQGQQFNVQTGLQGQEFNVNAALDAAKANQAANQANINSRIQAATGMGALGTQAQQNQRQQFLELSTAGAQEQQQAQNQINANINAFNQMRAYPGTQLGVLQSALGMTPYGSTTIGSSASQSQQQTNPSLASDIFGGLQALGGAFGSGGPFAAGGALAPLLSGSDRHLKTDVEKVGVHPQSGLPLYSYRYKGDPKSYPKITGPMAEDAMQVAPHAVQTVGVHGPTGQALHTVNMAALDAVPSIRPQRMPGASGAMVTRLPGALTPRAPQGAIGAMGASLRPAKIRPNASMPRVKGAMGAAGG